MSHRVLLAVDDSPASDRAIDYLGAWLEGGVTAARVVHALSRAPDSAPKTTPSGKPTRAERWLALSREQAQPILFRTVERLKDVGMDPGAIDDGFVYVTPDSTAAEALLADAREHRCDTLIVGRNALPWHRELFHHHLADQLIQKAEGTTIWVVE